MCGVDRLSGKVGFCKTDARLRAARAAPHFWEEPCISGTRGSGTVFFSSCNLHCVFCQNRPISTGGAGKIIETPQLADAFLRLQEQGCHNINLVTPTVWVPHIAAALADAKARGLAIPVAYNCGGYERVETLRELAGLVDIWMPDFKYSSDTPALKYSAAPNYAQTAERAIAEMLRQSGAPQYDENGLMQRGVIIRHMLLPGALYDTKAVLRRAFSAFGNDVVYSIMSQYTPMPGLEEYPELCRTVRRSSYEKAIDFALSLGITNAYTQQSGSVGESFIPDFSGQGL